MPSNFSRLSFGFAFVFALFYCTETILVDPSQDGLCWKCYRCGAEEAGFRSPRAALESLSFGKCRQYFCGTSTAENHVLADLCRGGTEAVSVIATVLVVSASRVHHAMQMWVPPGMLHIDCSIHV